MERREVFEYVKEQYDTEPDYPWMDWNAVLRHKENDKWYGLVMEVERSKLGIEREEAGPYLCGGRQPSRQKNRRLLR